MIETQILYYDGIFPAYQKIIEAMTSDELDVYSLRFKYSQLFGFLNDCIDYLAQEHGAFVEQKIAAQDNRNLARDLREALTSGSLKSLPLAYVRDIANVSKHLKISRPDKLVGNVSELKEAVYAIRYEDNKGLYAGYKFGVIVQSSDASQYNHCEIIAYNAIREIRQILLDCQVLKEGKGCRFSPPDYFESRSEATRKAEPTIKVMQGKKDVCTLKAYVYDESAPLKIRLPEAGEWLDVSVQLNVNLIKNPYD